MDFLQQPTGKNSARNGIFFQPAEWKVKYLQLISIAVETQQLASTTDDKFKEMLWMTLQQKIFKMTGHFEKL